MLKVVPILGTVVCLLAACGQRGPLYMPTGDVGAARASLPQALNPAVTASEPVNTGTGTANPAPRP
ncbi:MAG TPA: lipoprotein [Ramlibacter sp.]|nr:lipoprotein [Ramlibacter sp.]